MAAYLHLYINKYVYQNSKNVSSATDATTVNDLITAITQSIESFDYYSDDTSNAWIAFFLAKIFSVSFQQLREYLIPVTAVFSFATSIVVGDLTTNGINSQFDKALSDMVLEIDDESLKIPTLLPKSVNNAQRELVNYIKLIGSPVYFVRSNAELESAGNKYG